MAGTETNITSRLYNSAGPLESPLTSSVVLALKNISYFHLMELYPLIAILLPAASLQAVCKWKKVCANLLCTIEVITQLKRVIDR